MATNLLKTSERSPDAECLLRGLDQARARTLALVSHLDDEQLERVYSPLMSPLVWDLGHIGAYEDLWIAHRLGDAALLRPDLANLYDAFETPRAIRGEIEALGPLEAHAYLEEVRARTIETLATHGVGDGLVCEMVLRHELQHGETMRQTLAIAGLLPAAEQARRTRPLSRGRDDDTWVEIARGPFPMGAAAEGFAYDNERPRHAVTTEAFQIARRPVSNASWLAFSEAGGYEQRELWSADGWAWLTERKQAEQGPPHHPAISVEHPQAPACHISWYEAVAFALAHGARLPTEAEWEKAATLGSQETARDGAAIHGGVGSAGTLEALGRVWEWTESAFVGYPGFIAYPYREYSEVFFGDSYRVLRGGSWATDERVANVRFRNWDLPQRRQIFAGVRLARDIA